MWQNNVQQQVYISTHPIILLLHNTHTIENPSILSQLELETPLSFLSSYGPVYIRITLGGGDAGPASQPQNSISVLNLQIQDTPSGHLFPKTTSRGISNYGRRGTNTVIANNFFLPF